MERGGKRQGLKGSTLVKSWNKTRGGAGKPRGRGGATRGRGTNPRFKQKGGANFQEDREHGFKIMVTGLPEGAAIKDLVEFLMEKSQPFSVSDSYIKDNKAFIVIDSREEAFGVSKLNGIRWSGEKLLIKFVQNSGPSLMTQKQRELLAALVESHYNSQQKYLNLSNMQGKQHENVKIDFNSPGFMKVLFSVMQEKCPDVSTINLSQNRIKFLSAFHQLPSHVTQVANISLDSNEISDFKQLDGLKNINLREIVLTRNPISASMDDSSYRSQVTRRFPSLRYLDTVKVEPIISFDIPSHVFNSVLPPALGSYFDSPQRQNIAQNFLQAYFTLYDNNRQELLEAYVNESFFSCSIDAAEKHSFDENGKGKKGGIFKEKKTKESSLAAYIPHSRNLLKVDDMEKRVKLLYTGRVDIVHALQQLPKSHHILETFVADCYVLPPVGAVQLLSLIVHGQFWEVETGVNRCFDRTFLLTAAPSQSRAQQLGFGLVVVNDQLHIRQYTASTSKPSMSSPTTPRTTTGFSPNSSFSSPTPLGSLSSPTPTPSSSLFPTVKQSPYGSPTPSALANTPTSASELIEKLVYVTDLKKEYAQQCLEVNDWSYEKALKNFFELKSKKAIPPEAFLTQSDQLLG